VDDPFELVQAFKHRLKVSNDDVFAEIVHPLCGNVNENGGATAETDATEPNLQRNETSALSPLITPRSPSPQPLPLPRLPKRLKSGTANWPPLGSQCSSIRNSPPKAKRYRPPPPLPHEALKSPTEIYLQLGSLSVRSHPPAVRRSIPVAITRCRLLCAVIYLFAVVWLGDGMFTVSDLRSKGRRFDSQPFHRQVTTLSKLFTCMCLCYQVI